MLGDDPLGIALKGRAQQSRADQHLAEMDGNINARMIGGPLPDPAWDGLFQALAEKGVHRMGVDAGSAALPSTRGLGQHSAIEDEANGGSLTSNLANVYKGRLLDIGEQPDAGALRGLRGAAPQSPYGGGQPGQWQASQQAGGRMRIVGQRGTTGMNQSQRFQMPRTY